MIRAETSATVKCKVKIPLDCNQILVHFDPEISGVISSDLYCVETLSSIKRGKTQYVPVNVINSTKRDIRMKKGVILGMLSGVSAVLPASLSSLNKDEKIILNIKIKLLFAV